MARAIPVVFPNTLHRLCRWHITKKFKDHLAYLYKNHAGFKDQFRAILNWPLMQTEFEAAWKCLMDTFGLHDDATLVSMWNDREKWISVTSRRCSVQE